MRKESIRVTKKRRSIQSEGSELSSLIAVGEGERGGIRIRIGLDEPAAVDCAIAANQGGVVGGRRTVGEAVDGEEAEGGIRETVVNIEAEGAESVAAVGKRTEEGEVE